MTRSGDLEDSLWSERNFEPFDAALCEPTARAAGGTQTLASASPRLQIPIEDVPLGARVPTKNPKPWEFDDSLPEPDEANWQVVKFTVTRKDGGIVDAELLRSRSWVEAAGLEAGRLLPIDIEELQIEGSATVTDVEAAPAIAAGKRLSHFTVHLPKPVTDQVAELFNAIFVVR